MSDFQTIELLMWGIMLLLLLSIRIHASTCEDRLDTVCGHLYEACRLLRERN